MNARELMVKPPAIVHADDSLAHAAALMRDRSCGSVVVVEPGGRAVAMVTDRDVCLTALRTRRTLADAHVHQAMSSRLFTCGPDDDVAAVEDAMSLHQVRRLPVVDQDGRPVGVVSLDDIARAARRQADLFAPAVPGKGVARTLGDICRPHLADAAAQGREAAREEGRA